jgi:hypothetical protein
MPLSIEIEGLEPLIAALNEFPEIAQPELQDAAEAAMLFLSGQLAEYPDEPPGSSYTRTGTLGRNWYGAVPEFAPRASGFEASVSNPTPYGPLVQDAGAQAWMHVGIWQTAQEKLEHNRSRIEAYFEAALENIVRKLNALAGG